MGNEQMVVVKDNSLNSHLPATYQNYQVREAAATKALPPSLLELIGRFFWAGGFFLGFF